ncbi:heterogeneous nuclear ribonucleoprotein A0 isoform X2 [Brachypodium distachyon]|uniref:RRM domain-containing protein n=1 Tax=Brachypodium distachyon TaxID=15368 RepID=I1I860_BRADI|nr:heterogeneous nuclear ribonucleoprotein A0 isoform X2 [Brachypodium distachyon]KQJ98782.1 hypothetical protein BRADI_3g39090v3 [Brachypodium distachyon]|eukprot:XP_003574688.1 heterogeneous nuclear ribonucleoprotein A0 isoform X2 [Brachypodium distachyon]
MGKADARPREHGSGGGGNGSPGKIFVGGLPRDTTPAVFQKHFGQYGEIIDSVIMKNKHTSQPRGFGFITYADPAVVDHVMEDSHVINGKQVEIKRTIPKDSMQSNPRDFKTKKIFVGGLPSTLTEDDFKDFFEKYGTVVDHQIMRDHQTRRSRGFGFVVFCSEQVVDDLLANGNMIDLAGSKVEIKKAEPKKSSNPPPSGGSDSRSAYSRDSRDRPSGNDHGGLAGGYNSFNGGGFGPYRNLGAFGGSLGGHGGVGDYHGRYGRYYAGLGGYEGMSSFGYPSRFAPYGGGFDGPYAGGNFSGYRRGGDESFGGPGSSSFGGGMYGGPYDPALGGYGPGSTPDMNRGSFGGASGRYHPYG